MSFSQEAKDFMNSFAATGKYINDYQLTQARTKYLDAATKKLNAPDPVEEAFKSGTSALDKINTKIDGPDKAPQTAFTSVDQVNTDLSAPDAPAEQPMATSIEGLDTSLDSAGQTPNYDSFHIDEPQAPRQATGLYSSGGVVKRLRAYFDGGMVEDDEFAPTAATAAPGAPTDMRPEKMTALPVGDEDATPDEDPEVRLPDQRRGKDPLLGMAIHGTLDFLQDMFSMKDTQPQGALPVDPGAAHPNGGRFMFAGIGASSKEDYDNVMKVVDPHGQLDDNIRNIAGIKAVYDYYLKRGDIDKANKAAASLVQYTRNVSAQYGAAALDAYKNGDLKGAADLIEKGYNQIPDGNRLDVTMTRNGSGYVVQKDEDGNIIQQGPFSPEHLLQAATGMENGQLFWRQLMASAQHQLGDQPSQAYAAELQKVYGLDASGRFNYGALPDEYAAGEGTPGGMGEGSGGGGGQGAPANPGAAVTSTGNAPAAPASGAPAEQGPPPKPPMLPILQPDPQHLLNMSRKEKNEIYSRMDAENKRRQTINKERLKEWEKALVAYKSGVSRETLEGISRENNGLNPDGTPKEAAPKRQAVDTGEYFGPASASAPEGYAGPRSTPGNTMGIMDVDAEPEEDQKYLRYSTDPRLTKEDQRLNKAEVDAINKRRRGENIAGQKAGAKAAAGASGAAVKPEKRGEIEQQMQSALEQYQSEQPKGSPLELEPADARKIKSGAYAIYSRNDLDSNQAIERAVMLATPDTKDPTRLPFQARDMRNGLVTVRSGGQEFIIPKATFNELADMRLRRIKKFSAANQKAATEKAEDAQEAEDRKKNRALREANRGQPRVRKRRAINVDDDAADAAQATIPNADLTPLITGVGKAIAGTVRSAAKTYDKDFAKSK